MARRRIVCKLALILTTAAIVIAGLVWSIDDQALDNLKHRLSLWTLIALLLIINVVSFVSFLVMYMAWKWVRSDIKGMQKCWPADSDKQ
jgi:heme/copper-type cytochrome/quinol oxidase subunit 2